MRSLRDKAAFALSLALGLAKASTIPRQQQSIPAAFVSFDIPNGNDNVQSLTIQIDVVESNEICGPASLYLNNQPLLQDGSGNGQGGLIYGDGIFNATWSVSCDEDLYNLPHELIMTITSLDDLRISPEVRFSARFRQTAPVTISEITGDAITHTMFVIVDPSHVTENTAVDDSVIEDAEEANSENEEVEHDTGKVDLLQQQITELESLRQQVEELHILIFNKEAALMERMGRPMPPRPNHHIPVGECDTLRCVVRSLSRKMSHAFGVHGFPHRFGGPPPPPPPPPPHHHFGPGPHHGKEHLCPCDNGPFPLTGGGRETIKFGADTNDALISEKEQSLNGPPHGYPVKDDEISSPYPCRRRLSSVLAPLGIFAIILGLGSLVGLRIIYKHVARGHYTDRRAMRRARREQRRAAREERRNRHQAKKEALKGFLRNLTTRIFGRRGNLAMEEEKEGYLPISTMEEEISGFREAATVVSDLVSAEEGRPEENWQGSSKCPPYEMQDDTPPAYTNESRVVADGFTYTPTSSSTASNRRLNSNESSGQVREL